MRWLILMLASLLNGCAPSIVVVTPGEPVMVVGTVTGRFAHYGGRDVEGNPIWRAAAKDETLNVPGYILEPLPSATRPAK
jgi:hypothetical protein